MLIIVVYWATDANGEKKQFWEPFDSLAKAKRRKAQVEFEQSNGTFVCPTVTTVKELMKEYVRLYGVNKWAPSTYSSKMSMPSGKNTYFNLDAYTGSFQPIELFRSNAQHLQLWEKAASEELVFVSDDNTEYYFCVIRSFE